MSQEYTIDQLFKEIVFIQIGIVAGWLLIVSTKNGWNLFLDPPARLQSVLSKVGVVRMLSRKWEERLYYLVGVLLIFVSSALIAQRLVILARRLGYLGY